MIWSAIRGARHYNGRLGQEPEQKSRGWGAFRQVRRLAECQKSAEVKQRFQAATPSARQLQLAERLEFPERNEEFASIRMPFGGRGPHDNYFIAQPQWIH